eukprot:4235215-Prymnesium_polylepis.1
MLYRTAVALLALARVEAVPMRHGKSTVLQAATSGQGCSDSNPFPSVEVHIMRAYGFRDTDGWWNKPDPYVEAMLNGQTMTTAVHDDTMHAAFDHKFCFQGALSVQAYETGGMTLTLLDDDSWLTKSFDHLGTFYLNALETGDFTKEDGPAKLDIS